ncbi:L,D-transpeptidase [bacterium]|nr:L,D-transpeptidase [bacterium]
MRKPFLLFVFASLTFAVMLLPVGIVSADDEIDDDPIIVSRIIINLYNQRLYALNPEGYVVFEYPCSTGKSGFGTPSGHFRIYSKAWSAYSKKYSATMTNWMAFTPNGGYGIHGLLGNSYYRRLGSPASHGCVRLTREGARELYGYVAIGTPVDVVRIRDLKLPVAEKGLGQQARDKSLVTKMLEELYGDHSL